MSDTTTNPYEVLVLFPQSATADLQASVDHVRELLEGRKAEVLSVVKWDERRLAYDIRGNKRGLYILAYVRAPAASLVQIERDFTLSERILRTLITRCDHLSEEQLRNAEAVQRTSDEAKLRREPVAAGGEGGGEL